MLARLAAHPLWLVGFRPFFAFACLAGATLPLAWALLFTGAVPPPPTFQSRDHAPKARPSNFWRLRHRIGYNQSSMSNYSAQNS